MDAGVGYGRNTQMAGTNINLEFVSANPTGPIHLGGTLTTHEVIHLVAGRMTVTPDGGEATEISAGDVAVFPLGWSGTWEIHETVRKVYAIF